MMYYILFGHATMNIILEEYILLIYYILIIVISTSFEYLYLKVHTYATYFFLHLERACKAL